MKNLKPNVYDYLLSLFTANETMRPALNEPFPQEGHYCATDSNSLILFQDNLSGVTYKGNEKAPDAWKIFAEHKTDTEFQINKKDLLSGYFTSKIKFENSVKTCEKCKGSGYEVCKCCGHDNECLECDGTGEDYEQVPFGKAFIKGNLIQFAETNFFPNTLHKVLQTAYMLNADLITVRYEKNSPLKARLFLIGEVRILLMPSIYRS